MDGREFETSICSVGNAFFKQHFHYFFVNKDLKVTYKDVVLDPDHVAAPEVGGWEGRHEELLRLPVVRGARLDLATGHRRQLARFRLHHLVLRDVLDRLNKVIG